MRGNRATLWPARCIDCPLTGANNGAPGSLEFSTISEHLADLIKTDQRLSSRQPKGPLISEAAGRWAPRGSVCGLVGPAH